MPVKRVETHRCAVCDKAASFGYAPVENGKPQWDKTWWYCLEHRPTAS